MANRASEYDHLNISEISCDILPSSVLGKKKIRKVQVYIIEKIDNSTRRVPDIIKGIYCFCNLTPFVAHFLLLHVPYEQYYFI